MKPVTIKGVFDYDKEVQVEKMKGGERGVEVVTPFFTHLDSNDRPCGIAVNRGWIPWDLRNHKIDKANGHTFISGLLTRGHTKTKYTGSNQPIFGDYKNAFPEELAVVFQLNNEEDASQFMLHAVDFDEGAKTPMPDVVSKEDLKTF